MFRGKNYKESAKLFDKATFKNIIYNGLKQHGVEAETADKVLNSIEWIRGRGKILVGFKFMNYRMMVIPESVLALSILRNAMIIMGKNSRLYILLIGILMN